MVLLLSSSDGSGTRNRIGKLIKAFLHFWQTLMIFRSTGGPLIARPLIARPLIARISL